ncbi:MAG TPA: hypothetical protein VNY56_04620 [Methylomirabilota bacterium]|nr:hypothetical protein [Methylomirabilota bacterium]
MAFSSYRIERIGFGLLLFIGLVAAFEPLVRIHDPNGTRVSDAFDLRSGISQLQTELRIVAPIKASVYSGPADSPATTTPATPGTLPVPFSIRTAAIVPWCVFAALVFSLLALLDILFVQKGVAVLSLTGGFLAATALLHVLVLDSDLQAWTDALMSINERSSPGDSALGAQILMANSFFIIPGIGLYVLTACLLLVPFLSVTRAVPRISGVLRAAARIRTSQPIQIRPINSQYPAETCTSLDISQSGLYLESPSSHYYVGMELYLDRNHREGSPANPEEHGYVVRVEKSGSAGCRFAIHIISNA